MQVKNDPIIYRNQAFAIYHLIEDCPPSTVIRELTRNAIDAAILAAPPGKIAWFKEGHDGIEKLGLYNEGPGMSGVELAELTDLASTTKVLDIDENYGQGGKISGLKASPFGLIYRSCSGGVVSQIVLARQQEGNRVVYVKRRQLIEGAWDTVIDVTDAYRKRSDRDIAKDWTEVVLLGTKAEHNTVSSLLAANDGRRWLARLINRRFYRFPDGIRIDAANITSGDPINRNAFGLEQHTINHSEDDTLVDAVHERFGPIAIRFIKLRGTHGGNDRSAYNRRQTMDAYGISTGGDHACIVWRDECYDFRSGLSRIGGQLGIRYGASDIAVHVLLPHGAPIKNNTYRDLLIDPANENQQIRIDEFAELIRDHRPQWLIEYMERLESKSDSSEDVMERLRQFVTELHVATGKQREVTPTDDKDEGEQKREKSGGGGKKSESDPDNRLPESAKHKPSAGKRLQSNMAGIPVPKFTDDPSHLDAMRGRAAMYVKEENVIWISREHFRYQDFVEAILKEAGDDSEDQALAKRVFDNEYKFQVGKYVASAWMYRGRAEWNDADWDKALDAGSLTIHLTPPDCLVAARREFHRIVGKAKK